MEAQGELSYLANGNLALIEGTPLAITREVWEKPNGFRLLSGTHTKTESDIKPVEVVGSEMTELQDQVDVQISVNPDGRLVLTNNHSSEISLWIYGKEVIVKPGAENSQTISPKPEEYQNMDGIEDNAFYLCLGNERVVKVSKQLLDNKVVLRNSSLDRKGSGVAGNLLDTPEGENRRIDYGFAGAHEGGFVEFTVDQDSQAPKITVDTQHDKYFLVPTDNNPLYVRPENDLQSVEVTQRYHMQPGTYFRFKERAYYFVGLDEHKKPRVIEIKK
ncbi:MAG: hypothetical protein UX47_C0007G0009 [Candidatus Collierbacteria bacterium GW2011_GWA2_46_26]|uniref:Uncharacterized protein n=1 Tax=Candidatus Collierbacteria bacterium GW2011_GWA2_46_26 TaxID=1618381 RepID=A0A0G1SHH7_9BACT|nr:MAG: hypothetical protein UW29_C0009G0024 [Candidatus Collierbacteria bacterium GW2011_GWC2_44_13]KKU32765.1 MAG: hypothetical protein UX47_C0007G0009 [Candidatus Collierbacteria bacterium GW2011_GWA2_46_26]